MRELSTRLLISSRSLKLVSGVVSVMALALLALLAVGLFADDPDPVFTSPAPNSQPAATLASGGSALHAAIETRDAETVRILVEAGTDVDSKNRFGDPALHRAILKGDSEIVRILIDAGANANITNAYSDSALSLAVHEGNKEILQILVKAGGS